MTNPTTMPRRLTSSIVHNRIHNINMAMGVTNGGDPGNLQMCVDWDRASGKSYLALFRGPLPSWPDHLKKVEIRRFNTLREVWVYLDGLCDVMSNKFDPNVKINSTHVFF
jgi:hypothetical protein